MKNLAVQRQRQSTPTQMACWTLYRRRDLAELIEYLTELVSALVELVPTKPQQQLCNAEIAEINNNKSLVALNTILREPVGEDNAPLDSLLFETVTSKIEERRGPVAIVE
ncbi:MAG: hypothetical protein M1834_006723 [Cirrosporium novae-zelandiae]|nr:MAG: hypothetical protein M1834_006723 [Cirrosporium novae-zelandiae]